MNNFEVIDHERRKKLIDQIIDRARESGDRITDNLIKLLNEAGTEVLQKTLKSYS